MHQFGIGDGVGQEFFGVGGGLVAGFDGGDVLLVGFNIIAGQQTMRPVRPVFTAFKEDLALPCSVRGPVECRAFSQLLELCGCGHTAEYYMMARQEIFCWKRTRISDDDG